MGSSKSSQGKEVSNPYEEGYQGQVHRLLNPDRIDPQVAALLLNTFSWKTSLANFSLMGEFLTRSNPAGKFQPPLTTVIPSTSLLERLLLLCHGDIRVQALEAELTEQQCIQLIQKVLSPLETVPVQIAAKIFSSIRIDTPFSIRHLESGLKDRFPFLQARINSQLCKVLKGKNTESNISALNKSQILGQEGILLGLSLEHAVCPNPLRLYHSQSDGFGFYSLFKRIVGYTGPWILIIEHFEKDTTNEKQRFVFGAYMNGPINDIPDIQSDASSRLFTIAPLFRLYSPAESGNGGERYFFINNLPENVSKRRRGIGFGGVATESKGADMGSGAPKLWIDQDIDRSSVFTGNDATYGRSCLATYSTQKLKIRRMEIWGLGTSKDEQNQIEYWTERDEESAKRRKVNKKELVDGAAGMLMEKTFAHREQIVGDIEDFKNPKKNDDQTWKG